MKPILIRLAVTVGATLLTILAIEKVLEWSGYEYRPMSVDVGSAAAARYYHSFSDRSFVFDPLLVWRPKPGHSIFNQQGLRGPVLSAARRPSTLRVIALGDSNTLGWAGADGANWPSVVGRLLRGDGFDAEVVNAGVWGYSSFQGVGRLREVLVLEPDLVLISFGSNDAHRVSRSDRRFARRPGLGPRLGRRASTLRLIQLVASVEHRLAIRDGEVVPRVDLEEYRENLRSMAEAARSAGAAVVFLTRPFDGPIADPGWWKNFGYDYNRSAVEVGGELGVPVIDLYSHFKGRSRFFSDESHFTRAGHELAGRYVFEELLPMAESAVAGGARSEG